MGIPRADPCS